MRTGVIAWFANGERLPLTPEVAEEVTRLLPPGWDDRREGRGPRGRAGGGSPEA